MSEYPEHEKLAAISDKSQAIGEFLDWLFNTAKYSLSKVQSMPSGETKNVPHWPSIENLLGQYFHIDQDRINAEKEKMLAKLRVQHTIQDIENL